MIDVNQYECQALNTSVRAGCPRTRSRSTAPSFVENHSGYRKAAEVMDDIAEVLNSKPSDQIAGRRPSEDKNRRGQVFTVDIDIFPDSPGSTTGRSRSGIIFRF